MRLKPAIPDGDIQGCLSGEYGLPEAKVTFLPRGGDIHAAVYHVAAAGGKAYFLKLHSGALDENALEVPTFLSELGIREIIAPVRTRDGQLWTQLGGYHVVLSPYIEGRNAFEAALSERQWVAFGAALRAIHTAVVPAGLSGRLPRESYTPRWREKVTRLLERIEQEAAYPDPVAVEYARFLAGKAEDIRHIVRAAEQLSAVVQAQKLEYVLCHSDIHAGNLLVDTDGSLYIVDWDTPILAPKERDLMFIGGGVGSAWNLPQQETLFYQGYGPQVVNSAALAYYRFERIAQDIAEWAERVLLSDTGGEDRARWLQGLKRWFQPGDVVAAAYRAERNLP